MSPMWERELDYTFKATDVENLQSKGGDDMTFFSEVLASFLGVVAAFFVLGALAA